MTNDGDDKRRSVRARAATKNTGGKSQRPSRAPKAPSEAPEKPTPSARPKARRGGESAAPPRSRVGARSGRPSPAPPAESPEPTSRRPELPPPPPSTQLPPRVLSLDEPMPVQAPRPIEAIPPPPPRRSSSPSFAPGLDDGEGSIVITGICGRLGKLLTRELHRVDRVVGIDRRAFPDAPKDVVHHRFDVRRKKTRDVFRAGRVRAVVHLGVLHDPRSSHRMRHSWNVVAFQKLLDYMAQYGVRKLVVLSSANVYGPQPDNPQFLTEEAPLLGSQEFYAIRDLIELDMLAQSYFWRNPKTETVILRPCHILGSVRNAPSNYLRLERPITIMGFDPMIQVIHERDVVRAILMALRPGVSGIFNLRGPGELPLSRLIARAGRSPRSVPGPIAEALIQQMWRFRLSSFPSPEIDHIRYVCMVDDARARAQLGFTPQYGLDETLSAVFSGL